MTSLVFALQPDQVCVAMDTLVVGAEDRKPMCFQRKFLALPKIDLIVAGTGLANLINGWFSFVSSLQHLSDIDELNELAPATLKASVDAAGVCDSITTTLYHFGYSKGENKYIGYAYRSTSGFQSEKLEPPRVLRRLQSLREWSHEEINKVFARSHGTCSAHGL